MENEAVDIVIVNCDNDGYIQRCIEGVRKNTSGSYSLIVVDQDSHDGSLVWLKKANLPHIILNQMNVGTAKARNQAIRAGRSPWIAFIDSDIEIRDNMWLDKMWNFTIDHRIGYIEAACILEEWDSGKREYQGLSFGMVRRQCFNEIGVFDSKFRIDDDIEWFLRFEWSWWKMAYCPDIEVLHKGQVTVNSKLSNVANGMRVESANLLNLKYSAGFISENNLSFFSRRERLNNELKS